MNIANLKLDELDLSKLTDEEREGLEVVLASRDRLKASHSDAYAFTFTAGPYFVRVIEKVMR